MPDADLAAVRSEIKRMDAQTERIGLPQSFINDLYDLQTHTRVVRQRPR